MSCADDDMVKIWDVVNGTCLKTLTGQTESASHCGFHPSGTLVASGSAMTTLILTENKPMVVENAESPAPPHVLGGEEILDKPADKHAVKPRAQSARLSDRGSMVEKSQSVNNETRHRPGTAAIHGERSQLITNVERWLSSSFQRL